MSDWQNQVNAAKARADRLNGAVARALPLGAQAGAKLVRRESRKRAPVRKGALKKSSFDEATESGPFQAGHRVGYEEFYARFMDRGYPLRRQKGGAVLKYVKARPFFRVVVRTGRVRIRRVVVNAVRRSVRQEMRL